MPEHPLQTAENFYNLGIAPKLLESLDRLNFKVPTPIQSKAIPVAIDGQDMIGIAQTGTGKALAFGVPMIQRLARQGGKGLVVLPPRELALQVEENLKAIAGLLGLRTAILIGGAGMEPQIRQIRAKPHVVVGTPGRIIDHLERHSLELGDVSVLVFDEADRMLDMGFMPQIRQILRRVPTERQTLLFSATMPDDIVRIASQYMKTPVRIEVAPPGTIAERVEHELYVVRKEQKNRLLEKILKDHAGPVLVFSRTKFGARRICRAGQAMGENVAEIHSDRSLAQRREALDGFKSGKYRVLVATDIASRGIDVTGIELVINYDIPENAEDYVHRIGRTGRAGQSGKAISFAMPDQGDEVLAIEKLARVRLPISKLPDLPQEREGVHYGVGIDRGARGGDGGRSGGFGRGRSGGSRQGGRPSGRPSGGFGHGRTGGARRDFGSRPAMDGGQSQSQPQPTEKTTGAEPVERKQSGPLGSYFGPGVDGILGPAGQGRRQPSERRGGRGFGRRR